MTREERVAAVKEALASIPATYTFGDLEVTLERVFRPKDVDRAVGMWASVTRAGKRVILRPRQTGAQRYVLDFVFPNPPMRFVTPDGDLEGQRLDRDGTVETYRYRLDPLACAAQAVAERVG